MSDIINRFDSNHLPNRQKVYTSPHKLEFNVPFQHKYDYIRDIRSGVESDRYPVKEGQRYINLNPGRLFCLAATQKGERDREAHLNYYTNDYNRGDNYHTARQN